jgi:hypothetical protein
MGGWAVIPGLLGVCGGCLCQVHLYGEGVLVVTLCCAVFRLRRPGALQGAHQYFLQGSCGHHFWCVILSGWTYDPCALMHQHLRSGCNSVSWALPGTQLVAVAVAVAVAINNHVTC